MIDRINLAYSVPTPRIIKNILKKNLEGCKSILDLGCGNISLLHRLNFDHEVIGLDIWTPYAKQAIGFKGFIEGDILDCEFESDSFDAVLMSDSLEHLVKPLVFSTFLFRRLEKWARKKIIIITPSGYFKNPAEANPYQEHKSGWEIMDFQCMGYKTYRTLRFNIWRKVLLKPVPTIIAIKTIQK